TPRVDVQVRVDGKILTSTLDGKALPVEAGLHEYTFATDRGVFATEKVMIAEGEQNRKIEVSMGGVAVPRTAPAAAVAAAPRARVSTPTPEKSSPEVPSKEASVPEASAPEERGGRGSWALPSSPV